ncbi:hypothetical protein J1614_000019 [Plenodomus biglobosus]|nr:hypothetical protein J1614_000019 [Plenodomus biglobosus]
MCRIEERVYIGAEGHRSMFEERFPCDKSRNGKLCSKVKKKTLEYHTKSGPFSCENTPSPGNPPTPTTGAGAYVVQQRRPSSSGGRPFTRDGHKPMAPEITINFNTKKDAGKRHSGVTVSTKSHKRSSHITSPIGSGDLIDDFPGSDGSHTIRTGFPDAPLPTPAAFGHPDSYMPSQSHAYHHGPTSSTSSFNAPSSTPSLYVTSDPDYESSDTRRSTRQPPTIIQHQHQHQHQTSATPPSPSPRTSAMKSSVPYRTSVVAPRASAHDGYTTDNMFPIDHGDLADRSASSHASSGVSETPTRKSKDRDERHRKQEEERRREDERIRRAAEEAARENAKQVRFELDRPVARERERAEKVFAEKEMDRAHAREDARRRDEDARRRERKEREKKEREEEEEVRQRKKKEREDEEVRQRKKKEREDEEARQRKKKEREDEEARQRKKREREDEEARQRKKEKARSSTMKQDDKPTTRTRRSTMTQTQIAEQRHLLAAEQRRMEDEKQAAIARERDEQHHIAEQRHLLAAEQRRMEEEKQAAIARERDEQNAILRQQQDTREYFDPRGGNRSLGRRASVSRQHPPMPAPGLARSSSHRRTSIHQSNPPAISNPIVQDYSTRPPNVRQKTGPPVSFPANFNQNQGYERPPSTRRPSFAQEAPPSARIRRDSGSATVVNPFVQDPSSLPPSDPWDLRTVQSALPACRPPLDARAPNTMQQRGQDVINRSISQAQQATRAMYQDVNVFDDEDDDDDDDGSDDSDEAFGMYISPPRLRRKH